MSLIVAFLTIVGLSSAAYFRSPVAELDQRYIWLGIATTAIYGIATAMIVRRPWVKVAAEAYATQLLASIDHVTARQDQPTTTP